MPMPSLSRAPRTPLPETLRSLARTPAEETLILRILRCLRAYPGSPISTLTLYVRGSQFPGWRDMLEALISHPDQPVLREHRKVDGRWVTTYRLRADLALDLDLS